MSIREISEKLQKKAIKELNEDPKKIPEDIQHIKTWLSQNKYINARTEDQWILNFLRGCKFSLEKTKKKIEFYYTLKTLLPEFFKNRDPFHPDVQKVLSLGVVLPLPHTKEADSPRICLIRGGLYDPSTLDHKTVFKVNMMIQDILIYEDDQLLIAGGFIIQDMKSVKLGHVAPLNEVKKAAKAWQDGYPIRLKHMHYLNTPSFFEKFYVLMKPFLKDKILKRFSVHSSDDLTGLYDDVPKNLLPKEYGGEGPTIQEITDYWKKKVESYKDWFLEDEEFGTDEMKRPGMPKTLDEFFGIEGSFRKLNVD